VTDARQQDRVVDLAAARDNQCESARHRRSRGLYARDERERAQGEARCGRENASWWSTSNRAAFAAPPGGEFLGFVFPGYRGQIRVARKDVDKFKSRVREITCSNWL